MTAEDSKVEETRKKCIEITGVVKKYFIGTPNELAALDGVDIDVYEGEFLAIVGASGSGKSTLMNIIGALDRPTEGGYKLDGLDVTAANDDELSAIRNRKIGFVFQTYNLISKTSALKNVEMPMLYAGVPAKKRVERAKELLNDVGMGDRIKQRVAIARAMSNDPSIILADEPTGALDSKTGRLVMDIFHRLNKEQHKTVVLITHSPELAEECDRIISLKDGKVTGVRPGRGKAVGE